MNTEARVLATLNKIKEVQSKRQDLGVIEDAIQNAKDEMLTLETEMDDIINSYNQDLYSARQSFIDAQSFLQEVQKDYTSRFNNLIEEYKGVEQDLYFVKDASTGGLGTTEYKGQFDEADAEANSFISTNI